MSGEACFCATTKTGDDAGCACVSLEMTDSGPKFIERTVRSKGQIATHAGAPVGAFMRGDSSNYLAKPTVTVRDDYSRVAGPPAGALTR